MSPLQLSRRAVLLGGAGLAWLPAARGQVLPEQVPAPGPLMPAAAWPLQAWRLSNGLRVLLAPRPGWPLVSLQLQLGLGSLLDPPGKSGLSQLCLDVLSRGRAASGVGSGGGGESGKDLAWAAESLGASLEAQTQALGASLSLSLAAPRLHEGLALLAGLVRQPRLPPAGLEAARQQMLDRFLETQADPAALAQALGRRLFWGDSAAGRQPTPASLGRIRREDLLALQRSQLSPLLSSLIICGDFEPGSLRVLLERQWGGWQPGPQPGQLPTPVQARPLAARSLWLHLPEAGQSAVQLAAPHAGLEAVADLPVAQLAQAVLGQGYSSRLGLEVRIKRGLSYGASSQAESLPGGGWLSAQAQTRHEGAAEVAGLMAAQILGLGQQAVPSEELAARRASWLGEQQRRMESRAGLAAALGERLQQGLAPESPERLAASLQTVDAQALQAYAARYWRPERLRRVVVGDLRLAGATLRALDPEAWVIEARDLDLDQPLLRHRSRRGPGGTGGPGRAG